MKKQKPHATANQFEQALVEEIKHAQGMNVPVNAISSAVSFALLVHNRLFGRDRIKSQALTDLYSDIRAEAVAVRRDADRMEKQEQQEKADAEKRKIVAPGAGKIIFPGRN